MKIFKNRLEKVLFIKKLKNLKTELFTSNYFIVSSSVSPFFVNWGDDASDVLVSLINPSAKIIPYNYSFNIRNRNNYLCVGSIISWMTTPKSIIWGTGIQKPTDRILFENKEIKPLEVLAVRGPLTRKALIERGIDCPEIYGDPALLFPRYYTPPKIKKHKIGIIPHFKDKKSEKLKPYLDHPDYHIIDIQNFSDWRFFINEINSCEFIISSSLHGIIISDTYDVPNCWVEFDQVDLKRFTFQDYFCSVGKNIDKPIDLSRLENINELIEEWQKPIIDLDLLMSVCPFIKTKN